MRAVLHAGVSKTGSTALQDCLSRSDAALRAAGVLYPANAAGIGFNNHRLLLQPLLPYDRLPSSVRRSCSGPEDCRAKYEAFMATVERQTRRRAPDCLVLSCEHLFRRLSDGSRERLKGDLDQLGASQVEVAVYLRRPSARYLSGLQQALKTGRGTLRPRAERYRRAFRCYEAIFGKANLRARVFDRSVLPDGDVIADFVGRFLAREGVERGALASPRRANETVSAESMLLFAWLHRDFAARPDYLALVRSLHHLLATAEARVGAVRPRLREEIADMVDYSSDETLWLRNKRGLEFPGYDYARIERGDLIPAEQRAYAVAELVEVDAGVLAALVGEVALRAGDRTLAGWATACRPEAGA